MRNEVQPGSSTSESRREPNPDWPPPGYAEGPDGSLYAVKPPAQSESARVSRQTGDSIKQQKYGSTDEEPRAWPPAGYSTGPDGQLYAAEPQRENPFNRSSEGIHDSSEFVKSTDSFNPFDAS